MDRWPELSDERPALGAPTRGAHLSGFRTGWRSDTNTSGAVDTNDPMFWFCYDEDWRIVATFRGTDASPKENFVHHAAGLGGFGGSSYTDSVILRNRDASTAWSVASSGVLGQRHDLCQNWRAAVP